MCKVDPLPPEDETVLRYAAAPQPPLPPQALLSSDLPRVNILIPQWPEQAMRVTPPSVAPRGNKFRTCWLQTYSWLQYDSQNNIMFCQYCRRWSKTLPVRTSFADGSRNFRHEIVLHHHKCKAHHMCIQREEEQTSSPSTF